MVSHRRKLIVAIAVTFAAGSAYFAYSLFAAQAQNSNLAQAPLNTQVQIPPAFIMALDNSGSMRTDETLFANGLTGRGYFDTNASRLTFFNLTTGSLLISGTAAPFLHMTGGWNADTYAPLRSPEFNRAFFNPHETYTPWLRGDESSDPNSPVNAAVADPRGSCAPSRCASYTTYDFTATLETTESWRNGAVMPAGTWLYNDDACNRAPGSSVTQNAWIQLAADKTFTANCNTRFRYYPARVYLSVGTPAPPGFDISRRVLIRNVGQPVGGVRTDMYRYDIIASNFLDPVAGAAAAQNFANWWTYYGNRNRAMIAGITNALKGLTNMRVGSFPFVDPPALNSNLTMYDMGYSTQKATLINAVRGLNAGGGSTPSRRGTAYMINQFRRVDNGAPVRYECQRNAAMLFTDGYTNDSGGNLSTIKGYFNGILGNPVNDQDSALGAPYGGPPFSGGVASENTIADYAMWGYLTNPRPDLPVGRVPIPSSCPTTGTGVDCNPNLHVNFYGVTLGARGQIFDVNMPATNDPYSNPPNWQTTSTDNLNARSIDDIWHATLNARGEFINASTPADITAAMRRILATVAAGSSPSGSVAVTGARIGAGSLTVTPAYRVENEGTDWSSTLAASQVSLDANNAPVLAPAWEASTRFPAPAGRNVFFTRNNTTSAFTSGNVSLTDMCSLSGCLPAEITALGPTSNLANAVDYLLGDQTLEKKNGGPYRDRVTRLGDIVNSTPVVSSPTDDYGYGSLTGTLGTSYRTYLTTKSTRRYMVYVGANDGMFHAFDGGLTKAMAEAGTPADTNGGRERFAYIPATSLGHLGNLLFPYDAANQNDQKFRHRYYVDGPVAVSDAYYSGSWKTVAVGTMGAGGKGAFALNVTNASTATPFTASSRLWEVSDLNTSLSAAVRASIGHVLGKPVIVPVKTTDGNVTWKAIFGNGYESDNGRAVLFMVDIGTGTPTIRMIQAQEVSPGLSATSRNGLGNIVVVDRWSGASLNLAGRDGFADTVYAADQQGALWKFDIRDVNPANITIPLFTTQVHTEGSGAYRQPILGGLTATSGPNGGVMLYFGTGSFSFYSDPADTYAQTLYAVNDGERIPTTATIPLSSLVRYGVSNLTGTDRTVVLQASPALARGWYVNLPAGERFVGYPEVAAGVVFMPTYTPNAVNLGCSTGGYNTLFGLNARSGAAALSRVHYGSPGSNNQPVAGTASVALDTGGTAPVKDVGVMAIPRQAPPPLTGGPPPAIPPPAPTPPEQGCWMMVSVAGAQAMYLPYPCGRQSWRQIQ